jgi:hypothetical protein
VPIRSVRANCIKTARAEETASLLVTHYRIYVGFNVFTVTAMKSTYYLLGYNTVYSVEIKLTFRRDVSLPSSGMNKLSKISTCHLLSHCYLARLIVAFLTVLQLCDNKDWLIIVL